MEDLWLAIKNFNVHLGGLVVEINRNLDAYTDRKGILRYTSFEIDVYDEFGHTLLFDAVRHGDPSIVCILLNENADPNRICDSDNGPHNCLWEHFLNHLHNHVEAQNFDNSTFLVALALIDKIHDIDARFHENNHTLLQLCCQHNQHVYAKLLLEYGANVHTSYINHDADVNQERVTTIMSSICGQDHWLDIEKTLSLLLRYGVDIKQRGRNDGTLLHTLAVHPHIERPQIIKFLVYNGVENSKDIHGRTAGQLAIWHCKNTDGHVWAEEFARTVDEMFETVEPYVMSPRTRKDDRPRSRKTGSKPAPIKPTRKPTGISPITNANHMRNVKIHIEVVMKALARVDAALLHPDVDAHGIDHEIIIEERSLLYKAVANHQYSIMTKLLNYGADPKKKCKTHIKKIYERDGDLIYNNCLWEHYLMANHQHSATMPTVYTLLEKIVDIDASTKIIIRCCN